MARTELDRVDDQTVLAIAARATEDLMPEDRDPASTAVTEDEARLVVAGLLEQFGGLGPVDPDRVLPDSAATTAETGRRILGLMLDDPAVAPSVRDLVENPPADEQMGVELAVDAAVVLGLLVTWLQTKISLRIHRHDGKTDVDFSMEKDAASQDTIEEVTKTVASALGIGTG